MRHNINKFLINRFLFRSLSAIVLLAALLFTSCDRTEEEDLVTVKLSVYGPSPALRGGELKFIGQNLDKVTTIVLQPGIEIKEFVSKSKTEIVIVIPQEAMPGKVVVKSAQGDIETKTPLTFSEPIALTSFAPATAKAGDKLTINGDYLNLIAEVIFSNGVVVDSANFVSKTRYKIEVIVPIEAQTGKVLVSNGAEIPILVYSATELQVTLPAITALNPNPVKPGAALQITGTDFQLVKELVFADGIVVDAFSVNAEKTMITAMVPDNAKEGVVKLVSHSGVIVESSNLQLIGPAVTNFSPATVKNGAVLTITGTHLDLVTGVTFGNNVTGIISGQSATTLEVIVPLTAVEAKVTLSTNSGKIAETAVISLVKPTINSIAPLSLIAGNDITITGTHLDLVRKVRFVGGLTVDVNPGAENSLQVTVPPACVGTAVVTLITSNGTKISSTDQLVVEAANKPVITQMPSSVKPGAKLTIQGTKLHLVEAIYFENNVKAVLYGLRTETSIEVYVPETAKKGMVKLKLIAFNGDEVISPEIMITGTDPIYDLSYVYFNFDGKNSWWGDKGAIENDPNLSLDGSSYFRVNDNMNPWWTGFFWRNGRNDLKTEGVTVSGWVVKMDVNVLADITGDMKLRLKGSDGDFWAVIKGLPNKGGWYTVTVPLTDFLIDGGTSTIPNMANIDSDFGMAYTGPGEHVNMCIDNIRFEPKGSSLSPRFRLF